MRRLTPLSGRCVTLAGALLGACVAASGQTDLRIVGADGRETPVGAKPEKSSDVERGGGQKHLFSFHPSGLAPGRYALKVVVTDTATHATAESASLFDIK